MNKRSNLLFQATSPFQLRKYRSFSQVRKNCSNRTRHIKDCGCKKFSLSYEDDSSVAHLYGDFLNPGERIELRFLISGEPEGCDIKYRHENIRFVVRDKSIETQEFEYILDRLPQAYFGALTYTLIKLSRIFISR